ASDAPRHTLSLHDALPISFRINGTLVRIDGPPLDRDEMRALVSGVLTDDQKARFEDSHDLDFSLDLKDVGRFRVNAFVNRLGEADRKSTRLNSSHVATSYA